MPAKVLVTGAAGFVGSHLARLLLREGCEIYAPIRKTSNTWRVDDIVDSIHVIRKDLLDLGKLDEIQPEMCFHLAWYAVPGKYLTSEENLKMLKTSIDLASQLARSGCKKLIVAGTCFEYDTDAGYLSETSPARPRTLYAASKLALYHALTHLAVQAGMNLVWARLFYLYGPYEDQRRLVSSVICSLLRNEPALLRGGEQIRDFLHVEDVATALWAVAKGNVLGPVNIGSGRPVAVRDIAKKIGDILHHPELIRPGAIPISDSEPRFICANNTLLKNSTGWAPRYDLEDGLHHTVEWWKRHSSSWVR